MPALGCLNEFLIILLDDDSFISFRGEIFGYGCDFINKRTHVMRPIAYTAFAVVHYHLKHGGRAGGSLKSG